MKIGIMQPYFLPYLGYFQLINYVDKFIIYDTVQYINHGWINRNRILHPEIKKEWQYITVPIKKHPLNTKIKDVEIGHKNGWKDTILGQLNHYKKKSKFFSETITLMNQSLNTEYNDINRFNTNILSIVCKKININFDYVFSSELSQSFEDIKDAEERVISICKYMGASEYVNLIGGTPLYNYESFKSNKLSLKFLKMNEINYQQNVDNFISNLSIIDLFMFNDIEKIKSYLNNYEIITG